MGGKTYLVIGTITFILLIVFAVGLILFVLDRRDKHKEKQDKTEPEITEKIYPPDLQPEKKKNIRLLLLAVMIVIILGVVIVRVNMADIEIVQSLCGISVIAFFVFLILLVVSALKKWELKKSIIATCTCFAVAVICVIIGANKAKKEGIASLYAPSRTATVNAPIPDETSTSTLQPQKTSGVATEASTPTPLPIRSPNPTKPIVTNNVTISQINALKTAKSYLSFQAFSYQGLIEQLEYEKFSHEDAVYGVENCGANWDQQAKKSAESYLSFQAFSYKGLIEQLEYEGFTHEQAIYGTDKCGADWNEQAAKSAESYISIMSFSYQGLIEQLEYEGFTYEQAVYGAKSTGLTE